MKHPETRGTINIEDALIISHDAYGGDQRIMRLQAPATAHAALPGQFVHLVCDPALAMRRPMSIMRADRNNGFIDILYKVHGHGTRLLALRQPGDQINLLGPIGTPFRQEGYKNRPLLIGGGVGIPPMIFLAEHIRSLRAEPPPLVIMGSEVPFPFSAKPSRFMVPGVPAGVIASMPLLEDWDIPSRLTSLQGYPGCYEGYVTGLARLWIGSLEENINEIEIFACGPAPMLRAVAVLAREYNLPCQISLEEYMACAVGGCAGCTVRITSGQGTAMKRVCVDGPVFEAGTVFPAA